MTEHSLRNPPIVEAIVDLRTELPAATRVEDLAKFHGVIGSAYPGSARQLAFSASFGLRASGSAEVNLPAPSHVGFAYWSSDRTQAVQARLDGFTFSRFRPYVDWQQVATEAKSLWTEYLKLAEPVAVVRLAVRYVNRVHVPQALALKDFFNTRPVMAADLPQEQSNLLMRLEVPVRTNRSVTITMAADHSPEALVPGSSAVIFDIDAVHVERVGSSDPNVWSILDELRTLKNEVFFKSLTAKAIEQYE